MSTVAVVRHEDGRWMGAGVMPHGKKTCERPLHVWHLRKGQRESGLPSCLCGEYQAQACPTCHQEWKIIPRALAQMTLQ